MRHDARTCVGAVAEVAAGLEGGAFVVRMGGVAVGWVARDSGDGDFLTFEGFGGLFAKGVWEWFGGSKGGKEVFDHELAVDLDVKF